MDESLESWIEISVFSFFRDNVPWFLGDLSFNHMPCSLSPVTGHSDFSVNMMLY